jgi:hypothetical protein
VFGAGPESKQADGCPVVGEVSPGFDIATSILNWHPNYAEGLYLISSPVPIALPISQMFVPNLTGTVSAPRRLAASILSGKDAWQARSTFAFHHPTVSRRDFFMPNCDCGTPSQRHSVKGGR